MSSAGRSWRAFSRASPPSAAVATSNPALRSFSETTFRMWLSSSAIRINLLIARFPPPASLGTSLQHRQLEAERAPLAFDALDKHAAAVVLLDHPLHQGQAQARSLGHLAVALDPVELLEHAGQLRLRDSRPVVDHLQQQHLPRLVHLGPHDEDRKSG